LLRNQSSNYYTRPVVYFLRAAFTDETGTA
jgi:hypothetical protein